MGLVVILKLVLYLISYYIQCDIILNKLLTNPNIFKIISFMAVLIKKL